LVSGTITTLSPTTVLNISASNSINLSKNTTITGTLSSSGNITTAGNLAVNGGDITSTAAILNINAGGTVTVQDNFVVNGSLSSSGNATVDTSNDVLAALRITQRGTGHSLLVEDTTNPDSSPFIIDNAGNVGIGTSTISSKLNVAGDITVFTGNQIYASTGSATRPAYSFLAAESNNGFFRPSADTIAISTNGVERARVTSTGDVGIGTNNPNTKLDVNGNAIITGTLTTTGDLFVNGGDATIASTLTKEAILNLSSSAYGGVINTYGSSSTSNLSFKVQENQVMTLLNSPAGGAKLALEDPFSNGARYSIKLGVNELAAFSADESGVTIGTITSTDFFLSTANVDRVKIGSSSADVTLLTGNLKFGTAGKGIDFSATSDGAVGVSGSLGGEILDDYEEGTFTPTLRGSTVAGTFTYAENGGFYTKIGNLVAVNGVIDVSTHTGSSGQLRVDGLPFVHTTLASNPYVYSVSWTSFAGSGIGRLIMVGAGANSYAVLSYSNTQITTSSESIQLTATEFGTGRIRFSGFYRTN
jgi:hypothetical protein